MIHSRIECWGVVIGALIVRVVRLIFGNHFAFFFIVLVFLLQVLIHSSNFIISQVSDIISVLGQFINQNFLHLVHVDFSVFYYLPFAAFRLFWLLFLFHQFRRFFIVLVDLFNILIA